MKIKLQATAHATGSPHTLMRSDDGGTFHDVKAEGLYGNRDAGDFYRRVAAYMGALIAEGHLVVEYRDAG